MRRSKIYTPEMDAIIREHYADIGGRETARMINEKYGTQFRTSSMWDRAKRLGIKGQNTGGATTCLAPLWDIHPDGFVGPGPHVIGPYLLTSKSEPYKFNSGGKKSFRYACRCMLCGKDTHMLQHSLLKARKHGVVGCKSCAQKARVAVIKDNKMQRDTAAHRAFSEWVWVMRTMPAVDINSLPRHKLFDSQR